MGYEIPTRQVQMMQLTNKRTSKIKASYKLEGTVLENVESIKYSNLSGFESYPVPNQVVVSSRTTQQLFN